MPDTMAVIDLLRASGVECFTRAEWGSPREADGSYARRARTHPMPRRKARYHFLHLTVTGDTDTVQQGKYGARQIERYGYSSPPMVSYQDLITNEGRYFQGQDYGTKGTHTVNDKGIAGFPHNLNLEGYALALMQNVDDAVTDEQVDLAARVFAARELTGWVEYGAPILPHRKFAWKACPGWRAMRRLRRIRRLKDRYVKNGLPGTTQEDTMLSVKQIWRRQIPRLKMPAQKVLRKIFKRTGKLIRRLDEQQEQLDIIEDQLAELISLNGGAGEKEDRSGES